MCQSGRDGFRRSNPPLKVVAEGRLKPAGKLKLAPQRLWPGGPLGLPIATAIPLRLLSTMRAALVRLAGSAGDVSPKAPRPVQCVRDLAGEPKAGRRFGTKHAGADGSPSMNSITM